MSLYSLKEGVDVDVVSALDNLQVTPMTHSVVAAPAVQNHNRGVVGVPLLLRLPLGQSPGDDGFLLQVSDLRMNL